MGGKSASTKTECLSEHDTLMKSSDCTCTKSECESDYDLISESECPTTTCPDTTCPDTTYTKDQCLTEYDLVDPSANVFLQFTKQPDIQYDITKGRKDITDLDLSGKTNEEILKICNNRSDCMGAVYRKKDGKIVAIFSSIGGQAGTKGNKTYATYIKNTESFMHMGQWKGQGNGCGMTICAALLVLTIGAIIYLQRQERKS